MQPDVDQDQSEPNALKKNDYSFRRMHEAFIWYVKEFADSTTLHGVRYFTLPNLHLVESLLWLVIFVFSVYGAATMTLNSWNRYNANPTVIAIQKNYREWNITFPAATFCFFDSLHNQLAADFIRKTWGIIGTVSNEEDIGPSSIANEDQPDNGNNDTTIGDHQENVKFQYYAQFLRDLANTTYENLSNFKKYLNDDSLVNLNVETTTAQILISINHKSTFFDKTFKAKEFLPLPTEMGICYTHGGVLSDYITTNGNTKVRKDFKPPTCNILNTLCYARTEGLPRMLRYYVHSPYEIPDISSRWFPVLGRMDRDTSFTTLETISAPELDQLKPSQRKCRFMFEPTVAHIPVYSFNLCRMQCRKELAFRLCGCAPNFYTKERRIPICGIKGLACLADYSEMLISLRMENGEKLKCDCLPMCSDSIYINDREVVRQWSFPVPYDIRFRWAIEKFTKIRLKRDVIYSFEDLLVSVGGTAAFFLGCSVLSFVEIGYFFTLRLYWIIRKKL